MTDIKVNPSTERTAKKEVVAEESNENPQMKLILESYIERLKNIGLTSSIVVPHLAEWLRKEVEKGKMSLDAILPKHEKDSENIEAISELLKKNPRQYLEFKKTTIKLNQISSVRTLNTLTRSLYMQIFCEFDAFTGNLLKQIYTENQSLLKNITREISLAELLSYNSIESATEILLEKEIETFKRGSYSDQFKTLEDKFSIKLKKFKEWPEFIEMSQRRNLLVHADGIISDQYLQICKKEGCSINEDMKKGAPLEITPKYLMRSIFLMCKIGFMLCHTLWMKTRTKDSDRIQKSLDSIIYNTLFGKAWSLANAFGEFSLTDSMKAGATDQTLRIRIINTAIARKFMGDEDGCRALLDSQDWSASHRDFKLATLVLKENYEEAINMMRQIGKSGELLDQHAYHQWPLFEKFRERPDFYSTYEEIYGERYSSLDGVEQPKHNDSNDANLITPETA